MASSVTRSTRRTTLRRKPTDEENSLAEESSVLSTAETTRTRRKQQDDSDVQMAAPSRQTRHARPSESQDMDGSQLADITNMDESTTSMATRRSTRRTSARPSTTSHAAEVARPRRTTRRSKAGEVDPEQSSLSMAEADESTIIAEQQPVTTTTATSTLPIRSRTSVVGIQSTVPESISPDDENDAAQQDHELTSTKEESPEVAKNDAPLSDITSAVVNGQQKETPSAAEPAKAEAVAAMERPMDIMMKSRAIPQPLAEENGPPKPRLVITYLILTNFKSYSGRQIVGPFHPSFSSVVGPNGSGKSNVIDSLLFVFGFRASKMRQGKVSALIHNSAQFPNLPFCEVEVHFQEVIDRPEGGCDIVPDSQLILSRRAFKNNSSKYYLNGKDANFSTVTELLRERGIDLDHKRFLILQGEVESISQMKPKAANEHEDGLLEYLEDIIGTSKYKTPIEEAATEVESLNDVCAEKNNRVQHVEQEKNSLEEKKNKALAYVRDENELMEKQAAIYQLYIDECQDNTKVAEEAIAQMQQLLDQELEKHQGGEDGIKQLQKEYKKGLKYVEAMEQRNQAMLKELAKYDKELVKFEERKKHALGKQKKLEKEIHQNQLSSSECSSLIEKHSDDMQKKTAEIAALEKEMHVQEKELAAIRESLKGKTQGISDRIAQKQASLQPWNEKINEKKSAVAVAQSELDMVNDRRNAGSVALEEAKAKIASIAETVEGKKSELEDRRAEKENLEAEVAKIEHDLQKVASREPEIRMRISSARQKAEEAKASLLSVQNQGTVLQGLMRLKETGRIDGFHGRLGNLGTIDDKYDVAISTACPSLENLVVDSVEVGQHCIDYLRKNNLGRANFILLDRLPKRDLSSIYTPENVPRLFDLVKPAEERFAPAFFSVLGNTLVARDLEQANRIAYGSKRWRVVTLDGQLIDVSGAMSGGGTRVARGGMSSKPVADVSKEQVARLEAERDEIERKWNAFQEKQRHTEEVMRQKRDEIPKLQTTIQKIQLEIESHMRNLADTQRRAKEIAAESKPSKSDDATAAALEKQIASLNREIERLHGETAGVEEEIQALQDKIMEVGGVRLRSQKARVDGLKEQIDLLNEEVSNAEVAKSKNEKQRAKHEQAREKAEREIAQLQEEFEQLRQQYEAQNRDISGMREQTEQAQEELESKKEELAALKEEIDGKVAELNETRASEIEMRNRLEENQKTLSENYKKRAYWEDKLGKLSLHNVSDLGGEEDANAPQQLPMYTKDELADMDKESLKAQIAALEEKTQAASIDLAVLQEYRRRVAEFEARSADLNEALTNRDNAKARLASLRSMRLNSFMEGFSIISLRLKEMYQMITMGGNAELELVDSLDPFSEGILFSVMPPKKSWKNISNLSGGEKTLSSLALVFALHHYRPTPLYVMDEIDAALDFRNVSIVASYIKERTKNAQFVVISLRNNMFELASRLVGVYKVNHMTKSVTIDNKDYIARSA